MISITKTTIQVQPIIQVAENPEAGAINVFIGTVRNQGKGKKVIQLEYEAYEPMAIAEIEKIIIEAKSRWPIRGYAVSHRTGILKPGEIAVVVAISTPHRSASFEACQFIMDTIKAKAPIWKKEVFEDGEEWVSAISEQPM